MNMCSTYTSWFIMPFDYDSLLKQDLFLIKPSTYFIIIFLVFFNVSAIFLWFKLCKNYKTICILYKQYVTRNLLCSYYLIRCTSNNGKCSNRILSKLQWFAITINIAKQPRLPLLIILIEILC